MRISRRVGMYEQMPMWYSPVYLEWGGRRTVCYPIGLHWLVRWARSFWLWALRVRPNKAEHAAYAAGFAAGSADSKVEP